MLAIKSIKTTRLKYVINADKLIENMIGKGIMLLLNAEKS
jgi:hypothetical protein